MWHYLSELVRTSPLGPYLYSSVWTQRAEHYFGTSGRDAMQWFIGIMHDCEYNEELRIYYLSYLMLLSAFILGAFLLLTRFAVGYGRHQGETNMPTVPNRLSWFLQEVPSFIFPLIALWYKYKEKADQGLNFNIGFMSCIAWLMFTLHYFQRSFIYTYLMKPSRPVPIHILIMGIIFCSWNGYIQGFRSLFYANYEFGLITAPIRIIGLAFFMIGAYINIRSDADLRSLERGPNNQYRIPQGQFFTYVSCPNYAGEILEWFGYFLFCQNITAFAFWLFTAANTGPRAKEHHEWYKREFRRYPAERKALIPFVY
ncbi:unnamed protein product [Bursaphelenchus okinawaensis]|uniref:3-oxo-5-alpha-steroid 4-dehydrogenase C-terminal domain-containing protein n=1 Tax=Bursaphelenchus okinawaensis TaxID=465554 RepID=A0A811LDL1_9BILA|nr:unnamed protein product [Bursaphelenchus okinawaensis]CAG9121166.1 unnamed protein product [Bursaphelenchus okinawaensis]